MIKWHLRRIIEEKGISGTELSTKIKKHANTISRLRNTPNNEMPHIDGELLNNLCEALNCSPIDLIEYIPAGQTNYDIPKSRELNRNLNLSAQITNKILGIICSVVNIPSDRLAHLTTAIMSAVIEILVPSSDQ